MEAKDTSDEDNNHKRKTEEGFSNDCNDVFEQPTKRICLPLPGQTQITGFFLHENKQRLFRLLCELARQKNWREMSGVVSTLLRGTVGKVPPILHRKKYWASMEILSRIKSSGYSLTKIRCIYETWISKQALRPNYSVKRGFMIQLEFALYCVMQGNLEDAHNAIKFIVRGRDSGSDPIVNLVAGLISYQVWYSGIPKVMQLKNSDEFIQTGTCGVDANGGFCKKSEPDEYSFDHNAVKSQGVKFSVQHASDESIQNEVSSPMDPDNNTPMKQSHHVLPQNKFYTNGSAELSEREDSFLNHDKLGDACISLPYDIINDMGDILSLVVNEAENGLSIFLQGLDVTLLPIQRQQLTEDSKYTCLSNKVNKECYVDAVRNLQDALCSNPPLLAALLPLIQLLLLNGQVEEALEKLEKFCKESNAVLPFRLRASLLECFGRTNPLMLATCYEDILKKDPRCCSSLAGLIRLYKNGNYRIEPLLEMITLHLDATYASFEVWGELASCFLELQTLVNSRYEDDRMSTDKHVNNSSYMQTCFTASTTPEVFTKDSAIKAWKLRCRWWATRHFSMNAYLLETQACDWQLLTHKASCASHLYGQKFHYVKSVVCLLKENVDRDRALFLRMHIQKSLNLLENLNRISS